MVAPGHRHAYMAIYTATTSSAQFDNKTSSVKHLLPSQSLLVPPPHMSKHLWLQFCAAPGTLATVRPGPGHSQATTTDRTTSNCTARQSSRPTSHVLAVCQAACHEQASASAPAPGLRQGEARDLTTAFLPAAVRSFARLLALRRPIQSQQHSISPPVPSRTICIIISLIIVPSHAIPSRALLIAQQALAPHAHGPGICAVHGERYLGLVPARTTITSSFSVHVPAHVPTSTTSTRLRICSSQLRFLLLATPPPRSRLVLDTCATDLHRRLACVQLSAPLLSLLYQLPAAHLFSAAHSPTRPGTYSCRRSWFVAQLPPGNLCDYPTCACDLSVVSSPLTQVMR